jgi:hypothetical protein
VSIVITVVTPYAVLQVSDMQLTAISDGTVLPERQRKSMVLKGSQVIGLFGWAGLATIAGHNTGQWLHGQLDAMHASDLPLQTIAKALADNATLHFATLPRTDKRCWFAVGGLFVAPSNAIEPFFCRITNAGGGTAVTTSGQSSVKFEISFGFVSRTKPSKHPYLVGVIGDERTSSELPLYWQGLGGLLKRRADVGRIASACLQIARAIADKQEKKKQKDPTFVKTVGKNLLLVAIDNVGGSLRSVFFPEDGSSEEILAADVLSADVSTRDVVVESQVNVAGDTEIRLRGWFKVDQLPGPNEPPKTLVTFLTGPPSIKLG